ncbi:hypothetical protein DH2020_048488 [Rehmannia glutinosa]|uniref:Cation-transporting P-type ATPase N-terminal domain-containing protein n=1 Tax=Rehmannia glutinosa TaxID=99300 RepID=A0ABR0U5H5_REHGL
MSDENKTAPYRPHQDDLEAGNTLRDYPEDDDEGLGPFDIVRTKSAPVDRLRRWRQAALVLNASRRFRYTLDLKKEEERKQLIAKIRMHAQVIRAAVLFQVAGQGLNGNSLSGAIRHSKFCPETVKLPSSPAQIGDFGISSEELVSVKGVAEKLKSSMEKGVPGDETDLINRKRAFGPNTYPRKKGRSFWRFVWDACRDTTLIILMVAAAASLALGIKTEVHLLLDLYYRYHIHDDCFVAASLIRLELYGDKINALPYKRLKQAFFFVIARDAVHDIFGLVVRSGRRIQVSIFEIVVGDVVPLKIGDQVPADGLVISGHSLSIDESSMTGESKIVHKDSTRAPFLMSGCKVADGYGTMLVTSVGINTEWGLLMASISEDNGTIKRVATFIGIVGLAVAVVVLIVLVVRFFTGHTYDPDGKVQFTAGKTTVGDAIDGFIKIFTVAVTIVVVAVPEGLPLAVTLTLAYSMRKMMADKALVCQRLSACVKQWVLQLPFAVIKPDPNFESVYACEKKIDPPNNKSLLTPTVVSLLIEGIAQNTTGSVLWLRVWWALEVSGSPTSEKAILQ